MYLNGVLNNEDGTKTKGWTLTWDVFKLYDIDVNDKYYMLNFNMRCI